MTDARTGALAILREGRLTVLAAIPDPVSGDVVRATARVEGHRGIHTVALEFGQVSCSFDRDEPNAMCSHAYALRLITGGF